MEYTMSDLMQMTEEQLDSIMQKLMDQEEQLDQQLAQQRETHILAESLKTAQDSGFFEMTSESIHNNGNSPELAVPCVLRGGGAI